MTVDVFGIILWRIDILNNFKIGDIVEHRKGGIYQIIEFAKHTETEEILVIYKSVTDGRIWARPLEMFIDGRFKKKE